MKLTSRKDGPPDKPDKAVSEEDGADISPKTEGGVI